MDCSIQPLQKILYSSTLLIVDIEVVIGDFHSIQMMIDEIYMSLLNYQGMITSLTLRD
jgi:hypothetical protein